MTKKAVNVRLEAEAFRLLEERAQEAGTSPTALAKELLVRALSFAEPDADGGKLDAVLDALARIERSVPARLAEAIAEARAEPDRAQHQGGRRRRPMMTLKEYIRADQVEKESPEGSLDREGWNDEHEAEDEAEEED